VGRETVRAHLANFAGSRDSPGLVVIHEMWGLNDQIIDVADRLSRLGYVVIAPDLYRGKLETDPGLAQEMMRALDENRAVGIVKGAVAYLRRLDDASTRRVGTVGFGMGGRVSLAAALQGAEVQATVIVYGRVETSREALAPIKAPLLGIFAARDAGIPVNDVKKFEAALKEAGKDARIIVLNGVGHAFMNDRRADYEPEIAKDAWVRMQDWLADKLQPVSAPAPTPAGP
jgi:carboxymethylenebutenolidase